MQSVPPSRTAAVVLVIGAVVAAVTIFLETFTDPTDGMSHYHEALAAPVNLTLFGAVLLFLAGTVWLLASFGHRIGRAVRVGGMLVTLGFALGDLPHTVVDFSVAPELFRQLPHARAHTLMENHVNSLIGALSAPAILSLLVGTITMGIGVLRTGVLPRWSAITSLAAIPVAIALGILSAVTDFAPHPPVALYLGIAAYGLAAVRLGRDPLPMIHTP